MASPRTAAPKKTPPPAPAKTPRKAPPEPKQPAKNNFGASIVDHPEVKAAQHQQTERMRQTAVTIPDGPGTNLALADKLKAHAVRQREEIAKAPATTGNMISFRGGTMTLDEKPLGHEVSVIVLAAQFERSYYPGQFVAGEATVPSCYSRDNVAPHPDSAFPQNETCKGCQWNEFDTAREGGGKACKEGLKLAMVAADTVENEGTPAIAQCRLSVLNAKNMRHDLAGIQAQPGIDHTVQAICTLTCVPDNRSQYKAGLRFEGYAPGPVVDKLAGLIDPAVDLLNQPYAQSMAIDPKAAAAKGKPQRTVKNY